MTDSDDTDDLLLIPPDFFAVESDSVNSETIQPYYNIVDNLIRQVDNLQNRLNCIESCGESFCSNLDCSTENLESMEKTKSFRRFNSTDDLCTSKSAQNSPQKPLVKLNLNSLPNSPNTDRYYIKNSRRLQPTVSAKCNESTGDGQVTNEVDTFLTKVKTIQRINAARNLENDFNSFGAKTNDQQRSLDFTESVDKKPENNKERSFLYESGDLCDQDVRTKKLDNHIQHLYSLNSHQYHSFTDSSSDSTQVTSYIKPKSEKGNLLTNPIHSNAVKVLNVHKKLLEDSNRRTKTQSMVEDHKQRGKNTIVGDNFGTELGLMNLADIWESNGQSLSKSQLKQKFQEEKYRRQHCEDLIQELQAKNLKLQQKMSVAVKVDETKNLTIKKYQDAMEKLVFKLEKLNKEKIDREFEINKLKNRHIDEKEDSDQKIAYYEKEVTRLVNLAHTSQENSDVLDKRCVELENETKTLSMKLLALQQDNIKECDKYKQISEILTRKEIELNENKVTLSAARSEISESKQAVELAQTECTQMKKEFNKLENILKEEKTVKQQLNKRILELTDEIERCKKDMSALQDELYKNKKQMESNKVDLRNFYQGQVEILVQSKLKEFQCQLDETENKFKEEISKREMSIAKSAATHIQQISEKYSQEIELIEEKHREECKLYQIQMMQYKQQIENLKNKLEQFQEKRLSIARQLQKVMESQWTEALRIITSGRSPTLNDESTFSTIDQLNSLKTKSYNNVEEVLSQHDRDFTAEKRTKNNPTEEIGSTGEKLNFLQCEQSIDTPVSSRIGINKVFSGTDIQQLLSILLSKPSGNPSQEAVMRESQFGSLESYNYFQDKEDGDNRTKQKERRGPKPPWK